jgi:hypothetical protein
MDDATGEATGPANDASGADTFPPLPLEGWEDTKNTLHRFAQIVGKIRLGSAPRANHWWHVTLYVTTRGLTTSPMPHGEKTFAIDFDFIDHRLVLTTSSGAIESFGLEGLSVARFYEEVFSRLSRLGIDEFAIVARPYHLAPAEPFATDTTHASYNKEYVNRYWRILAQVDAVFKEFGGRFTGKISPVHLFGTASTWRSPGSRGAGLRREKTPTASPARRTPTRSSASDSGRETPTFEPRRSTRTPHPNRRAWPISPSGRKERFGPTLEGALQRCLCTTTYAR